jgi:hypothetical protein
LAGRVSHLARKTTEYLAINPETQVRQGIGEASPNRTLEQAGGNLERKTEEYLARYNGLAEEH